MRIARTLAALLLACAGHAGVAQAETAPAASNLGPPVNAFRAAEGETPLRRDAKADAAALAHARDMARRGFFGHTGSDGSSVGGRLRAAGCRFTGAAENIAKGQQSDVEVVAAWVASMSLLCIDAEVEAAEAAPRTTAQHRAKRAPPTYGSIVALGHGSPRQTVRLAAAVSGHPHGSELVGSGARLQHGWEWQAVLATCSQFAAAVAMLELVPKPAGAALAVLSALYVFPSLFW